MINGIKSFIVYINLGLICAAFWYCVSQLILTMFWDILWH